MSRFKDETKCALTSQKDQTDTLFDEVTDLRRRVKLLTEHLGMEFMNEEYIETEFKVQPGHFFPTPMRVVKNKLVLAKKGTAEKKRRESEKQYDMAVPYGECGVQKGGSTKNYPSRSKEARKARATARLKRSK